LRESCGPKGNGTGSWGRGWGPDSGNGDGIWEGGGEVGRDRGMGMARGLRSRACSQDTDSYPSALRFYDHVLSLAGPHLRRGQTHDDQLVDAAESTLRSLAEGGCSFSPGTKSRFYRTAQGSAGECAGCLTIIERKFPALRSRLAEARGELELTHLEHCQERDRPNSRDPRQTTC